MATITLIDTAINNGTAKARQQYFHFERLSSFSRQISMTWQAALSTTITYMSEWFGMVGYIIPMIFGSQIDSDGQ